MISRWDISAGELFEWARPAAFALSALVSAWVLMSARRQRFASYAVAAWTLAALFFTLVTLPIYLIVRAVRRRKLSATAETEPQTYEDSSDEATTAEQRIGPTQPAMESQMRWRFALPLLYLLVVLSLGAFSFYREARSVDAHLARANQARVRGRRDQTIRAYRAALQLEENAHTRNLLGIELAAAGQLEEALAEFRAAERGNEPDDQLPYRIAITLDALNRRAEAMPAYQKFLDTRRCRESYPDPLCAAARARVGQKL